MRIDLTGTEQEQRKSPARSSPPVPLVVAVRKSHPVASALFCCGCCRVHKDYDYRSVTRSDKNRRTKEQDEQDGVPDVRQGRQDNHLGRIKIEKETTISSSSSSFIAPPAAQLASALPSSGPAVVSIRCFALLLVAALAF